MTDLAAREPLPSFIATPHLEPSVAAGVVNTVPLQFDPAAAVNYGEQLTLDGSNRSGAVSTVQLIVLPSGISWDEWELTESLLVEVVPSEEGVFASPSLVVDEYGMGSTLTEALDDLLTSMSEYLDSLQSREARLGPPGLADLAKLRKLLRPSQG